MVPRKGSDYTLHYSCLENSMDIGAWWGTVHGVARVGHDWVTNTHTLSKHAVISVVTSRNSTDYDNSKLINEKNKIKIEGKKTIWSQKEARKLNYKHRTYETHEKSKTIGRCEYQIFVSWGVECPVAPSCLTLCGSMDCKLSGFAAHGIFQARVLEWVAISYSRDLPGPGIKLNSPVFPALADGFFTI